MLEAILEMFFGHFNLNYKPVKKAVLSLQTNTEQGHVHHGENNNIQTLKSLNNCVTQSFLPVQLFWELEKRK